MTARTWVGGNDDNNALAAANWSPAGTPQMGDDLTVVTGTLNIANTNLAKNVLNLQDATEGGGPVVLNLNGNARVGVAGSLFFGDNPTFNVTGFDRLDASGGLSAITGSIDLAKHSHLVVTGSLEFVYTDSLSGAAGSSIVNNGTIETEDGLVSVAVRGTGTLGFSGYHDGAGVSEITSAISHGQTIALDPAVFGMTLTLTHPDTFHGILDIIQPPFPSSGDVSVGTGWRQGDELRRQRQSADTQGRPPRSGHTQPGKSASSIHLGDLRNQQYDPRFPAGSGECDIIDCGDPEGSSGAETPGYGVTAGRWPVAAAGAARGIPFQPALAFRRPRLSANTQCRSAAIPASP